MPRSRRTPKTFVDLAGLMERAQQHQPYGGRSSHVFRQTSRNPEPTGRIRIERSRTRIVRSRQNSRRATAIWTTAVYPISILQHLPFRRGMRQRRSYRSRSRRNQRTGAEKQSDGTTTNKDSRAHIQTAAPVAVVAVSAEVEMPCCATESPTAETQLQVTSNNTDISCQQPSIEPIFTPPTSTVILHHNPLFDVEGKTQSGLFGKHMQMAAINQAKSRWQMRREKTDKPQTVNTSEEAPTDAAKKKSRTGVEKKVPAKKGKEESGSDLSSNASNSHTTLNSAGSTDKSKSDTEESHSYEESIDLTTESVGVNTTVMNLHKADSQVKRRLKHNASKAPLALHNATQPKQLKANVSVNRVLGRDGGVAATAHLNIESMLAK